MKYHLIENSVFLQLDYRVYSYVFHASSNYFFGIKGVKYLTDP